MPSDIEKLTTAKNEVAKVYENQAKDDVFDNGLLDILNEIIKGAESAIKTLASREESE